MFEIRRFFQEFGSEKMIEVNNSPINFDDVDEAYNYIHARLRNFIDRSQNMGTTEDGRTAKLPACFTIDESRKTIDFHHGNGRIDTRLVCNFEINPPVYCLKYPH